MGCGKLHAEMRAAAVKTAGQTLVNVVTTQTGGCHASQELRPPARAARTTGTCSCSQSQSSLHPFHTSIRFPLTPPGAHACTHSPKVGQAAAATVKPATVQQRPVLERASGKRAREVVARHHRSKQNSDLLRERCREACAVEMRTLQLPLRTPERGGVCWPGHGPAGCASCSPQTRGFVTTSSVSLLRPLSLQGYVYPSRIVGVRQASNQARNCNTPTAVKRAGALKTGWQRRQLANRRAACASPCWAQTAARDCAAQGGLKGQICPAAICSSFPDAW